MRLRTCCPCHCSVTHQVETFNANPFCLVALLVIKMHCVSSTGNSEGDINRGSSFDYKINTVHTDNLNFHQLKLQFRLPMCGDNRTLMEKGSSILPTVHVRGYNCVYFKINPVQPIGCVVDCKRVSSSCRSFVDLHYVRTIHFCSHDPGFTSPLRPVNVSKKNSSLV